MGVLRPPALDEVARPRRRRSRSRGTSSRWRNRTSAGAAMTPAVGQPAADAHRRTGAGPTAPGGRSSSCGPRSAARSAARARAAPRNARGARGRPPARGGRPRPGRRPRPPGAATRLGVDRHRVLDPLRRARSAGGSAPPPRTGSRGRRTSGRDGRARRGRLAGRVDERLARPATADSSSSVGAVTADRALDLGVGAARSASRSIPRSTSWSSWTAPPIRPRASPGRGVRHDRLVQVGQVVDHLVRAADRVEVDRPGAADPAATPRPSPRPRVGRLGRFDRAGRDPGVDRARAR